VNHLLHHLNRFDWIAATVTLIVGLALLNPWVITAGVVGLVAAWYKPAERIKKYLEDKMLRRRQGATGPTDADLGEDLYAQVSQVLAQAPAEQPVRTYRDAFGTVTLRVHPSRHNWLKVENFNLAGPSSGKAPTWG